jgi:hypothetical protein
MSSLQRKLHWVRKNISSLILAIAVVFQIFLLYRSYIAEIVSKIWQNRTYSASYRSASILFDSHYAEYIEFVKSIVPEDGLLIIPKEEQVWDFGNVGLMQYFLFPRQIADCPTESLEDCILHLKGSNSYILVPDATFPPRGVADQVKQFIPFKGDRGLYIPLP